MRIFTLLLFYFPISIFAQIDAEYVWQKTSQKLNSKEPFKVKIKYNYKTWNKAEDKSGVLTAYFHEIDTQYKGYLKYHYLINDDTSFWYKDEKYKFGEIPSKNKIYIDFLFEDFKTIENPLIERIINLKVTDKFYLDSFENNYLLYAELNNQNASENFPNAHKIKYEYKITKNDFSLIQVKKNIETGEGELISIMAFETEFISKKVFKRALDKYLNHSDAMIGMDFTLQSLGKIKPKLNKDSIPASILSFSIETLDGKMVSNTDNQKLYLLDFWFVSCKPCQQAMPYLQLLHEKYKDKGLLILGLNPHDKDTVMIQKTLKKKHVTYPISMEAAMLASELKVNSFPTLFLVNNKGEIITAEIGFDEKKMLELEKIILKELEK